MAHGCEAKGFLRTIWRSCSRWRAARPGWLPEGRRFQLVLFEFPLQLPSIGKECCHFDRAHGQEERVTALPPTRVLHVSCATGNYLRLEPSTIEPATTAAIGKSTRRRLWVSLATCNRECRTGALVSADSGAGLLRCKAGPRSRGVESGAWTALFSLSSDGGGEGRGEESRFYWIPPSPTLSPLVPRGERATEARRSNA